MVAFTGTGTPGSTITIDPKVDGLAKVTTQVTLNGKWSVNRYLGSGAYDFDVYQTTPEGEETGRTSIQINQPASVTRPFVVTSPVEGSDHKNELVTFTGTGTPGSEVRVHVSNFTSVDATAQVASNGHWSVSKWLGGGTYVLDVTQTTNGAANGSTTLHLNKTATPIDQPFAITSHADGDTFTPRSRGDVPRYRSCRRNGHARPRSRSGEGHDAGQQHRGMGGGEVARPRSLHLHRQPDDEGRSDHHPRSVHHHARRVTHPPARSEY
ncbi:hypothetical protein [Curtobacterium sp. MCJR17_043]|uniref:hypothetical protein n=1 Tax=Curtobacterium sp. MCJR17_043 TaxID=2175660 RepID=UPI0024E02828|nr:hypothetical protein [Curtobacterium sp. MCJR17_043]WIB36424.1 hypothetical protein DEJ15_04570 [Curtobacterium sp. MCJR17_043]